MERIIDALEEHINSKGYLGEILPEGEFSEQQLSGHNWLLSGLIEYYLINSDKRILGRINAIIDISQLFLLLRPYGRSFF